MHFSEIFWKKYSFCSAKATHIFSYFSTKILCCGYSLEVPRLGSSMEKFEKYLPEYPSLSKAHCFDGKIRKLSTTLSISNMRGV